MAPWLLEHETTVRLSVFFGAFAMIAGAEAAFPRRTRTLSRTRRWPSNILLVFLNTTLVRIVFPFAPVFLAVIAHQRGWGFLNTSALDASYAVRFIIAFIMLDLAIYVQHRIFHAIPLLWRIHRVHHSDLDYDITTGARFHPIEILLSIAIKIGVIVVIGAPAAAVVAFEIVLNASAMFNHANLRLPKTLDALVRILIVTPDMHRVHHSVIARETHSNFGFFLSPWDRLFATYRAQPEAGHLAMTIGLPYFRKHTEARLDKMLRQPFISPPERPPHDSAHSGPTQ